MIEILRIVDGKETVVCPVPDDNASVVSEIMGREEVNVGVTVDSPLGIRVGDFVRVDGTVYTLNREAGMEKRSDVEYRYDLVFESPLYRLLDKLFTHPVTGVSTFTVSRTLREFTKIIVDCINTIDPGWTVSPGIPDTDPVNLTFEGISCREALTRLSDGFGMEFYLSGKEIRFVRDMENATGLVFEQGKGKGLYTVTQEPVDTGDVVTRVYPYGGTTNVFPADGDVNGRLYLPERYLEDLTGYGKVVEREVVFDDIFPCLKASVDSVSGEYNRVLTCEAIGFDINLYGIGGVAAKINFLSGDLMGESFPFTYTHVSKQINLIRKEDMTALPDGGGKRPLIPHDLRKAKAGDRFNLTDIYVPEEYKEKAIGELRARATDYLAYYSRPRVKFTLEVDHRYLRGRRVLRAGDTVTVKIPETGMEKPLRVNSVERNLKTGKMSCVVSNYLDEKWEKRIEGEIASVRSSVSGDISDIRGEVSNVSRPSSLWYPDKLREYLRLNEDGTISLLATDLIVEGHILSRKSITAYASDGSTPTWFDDLPIAGYDSKGIAQIEKDGGLLVTGGLLSLDPSWKGNGKTYYAGTGLKLGTKAGSGEIDNEFAISFGKAAGTVAEGNDPRLSDGQKALDRLAACSWWGQKLPEDGIITGALSGVTKINGISGSDGALGDLFLNYVSDAKNVRIDKDGNLVVSGNIKATGSITAYVTDGATREGPIAGHEDGALGMIRAFSGDFTIEPTTGLLKLKEGIGGGISDILAPIGVGNVITSLGLADGGRKIQPYTGLTAVDLASDQIITGSKMFSDVVRINSNNVASLCSGTSGEWDLGFQWTNTSFTGLEGSLVMQGIDGTPNYISLGFGVHDDTRRIYISRSGNVGIGTPSPLVRLHVSGVTKLDGYVMASSWVQCDSDGFGLYNAANDARWYASGGSWRSDKPISMTGLLTVSPNTGSYSEGIRIGSFNDWSNIQFGANVSNGTGLIGGQWLIGKNPGNAFIICPAGHETTSAAPNVTGIGISLNGVVHISNWLYSYGNIGWYNVTYGGGIYMDDGGWVKAYYRPFMCPASRASGCTGFSVNLVIGGAGALNCGAEWECSDNIFGIGLHVDDHVYFWQGVSADHYSSTGKSYCGDINLVNNLFSWYGPVRSLSAITAYSSNGSDMRRKTVINPLYDLDPLSLLDVRTFTYSWDADTGKTPLVGMSAQQMLGIAPDFVMIANDDKGDYYTFDYGRFGAIGLVKTVQYVFPWMDRMDRWKDRKDREIDALRKSVRSQGRRITELEDIIQTLKAA